MHVPTILLHLKNQKTSPYRKQDLKIFAMILIHELWRVSAHHIRMILRWNSLLKSTFFFSPFFSSLTCVEGIHSRTQTTTLLKSGCSWLTVVPDLPADARDFKPYYNILEDSGCIKSHSSRKVGLLLLLLILCWNVQIFNSFPRIAGLKQF